MPIRLPIAAGTFYPSSSYQLKETIKDFLQEVPNKKSFSPRALIVPHAGYEFSGLVAAYAYKLIQGKKYSRVILLGPSHYFDFEGLVISSATAWETPLGKTKVLQKDDWPQLKFNLAIHTSETIHKPEHCLEVQLPFLQATLTNFKIFPILMGNIDPEKVAEILLPLLDEQTLLVVSSDLSHYLTYVEAKKRDQITIETILQGDPIKFQEKGEACGKMPITALMYIAQKKNWQSCLLKALNSGNMTNDYNRVVGYASFAYSDG